MQNPLGPWGQQEDGMGDIVPTGTAPQRGRPKRPPRAQRVHVLTLRVPEELLRRLDTYTAQVQATQPYLRLSRADVLRMLLDKGLSATSCQA
jgi:hypothetical protein